MKKISLAILALCTVTAIQANDLSNSLLMDWRFDEKEGSAIVDSSAIRNPNGTIVNTERCDGIKGKSLRFKGPNSYASMPEPGSVYDTEGLTLEFSFKPEKLGGVQYILGSGGIPYIFARIAENSLHVGIQIPDVGWREIHCYTQIGNNTWYHVIISMDKKKAVCYINGEKAGEVVIEGAPLTNKAIFYVGRTFWSGEEPFYGIVDEIKLYGKKIDPAELLKTDPSEAKQEAIMRRIEKLEKHFLKESIVNGIQNSATAGLRPKMENFPDNEKELDATLTELEKKSALPDYKLPDYLKVYAVSPTAPEKILPDTILEKTGLVSGKILSVVAAPGEYEAVSFAVRSEKPIDKFSLSIKIDGITENSIDSKYVVCWKQDGAAWTSKIDISHSPVMVPELLLNDPDFLNRTFDKAPLLTSDSGKKMIPATDASSLQKKGLPAEFNQQMLITFHIPESQKAGLYSGNINILDGEKEIAAVPLNVRVLPFKLSSPRTRYNPGKKMVYSIYYWGTPTLMTLPDDSEGKTERNDKQFAVEMKDLAQHGITSPIFIWNNDVFFNSPDKVKKGIAMAREAGLCSKDIYFGWSGNTDPKSPEKLAELTAEVKKAIAQFRTLGITGDVYMYCRDEQRSESELRRQLPAMKAIQAGGAKLLVSCFGGAFDVFGGILDLCIWYGIPNRDEAAAWHSKQGLIWNYGAPQAGTEDPEIYRRNFGLLLWSMNYDGASDYCYADPFKKDRFIHGWNFVYQTFNGIIRTIYWDGFREAIDDVRYASTLQAAAEGKESQEAVAAMRFLNGINPKKDDPELLRLEIIQHILAMQNNKE